MTSAAAPLPAGWHEVAASPDRPSHFTNTVTGHSQIERPVLHHRHRCFPDPDPLPLEQGPSADDVSGFNGRCILHRYLVYIMAVCASAEFALIICTRVMSNVTVCVMSNVTVCVMSNVTVCQNSCAGCSHHHAEERRRSRCCRLTQLCPHPL